MEKVLQEVLHSTLTMTHSQRPYLSYASETMRRTAGNTDRTCAQSIQVPFH